MPSMHTLRCTISSNVGVSLFVLITKAVEGLEEWDKQMQAPTSFFCRWIRTY